MRKKEKRNGLVGVARLAMKMGMKYLAEYGHGKSRHDFTQRQLMSLLVLRAYLKTTYRGVVEILEGHGQMRAELGLEEKLPHWTTLQKFSAKKKVREVTVAMSEALGREALERKPQASVAVDATGMETSTASAHFKARSGKERKRWVKLSAAVVVGAILPMAVGLDWGPGNDKAQAPELVEKIGKANEFLSKAFFDAGYDAEWIHQQLRKAGITTIIKPARQAKDGSRKGQYRSQMSQEHLKEQSYGLRWHVESFWSALKRTMGDSLRAKQPASLLTEAAFRLLAYSLHR